MTTIDYSEATAQERYDSLKAVLEGYKITFSLAEAEQLGSPYKTKMVRAHYKVKAYNEATRQCEVFPFFQPEKLTYRAWEDRYVHAPLDNDDTDRLLSFFHYLACDYGFLESEGIKDALDYMETIGVSASEARKQYTALREQEIKLNTIFGCNTMEAIQNIMEGY